MAKQTKAKAPGRRRQTARAGLVTSIAGIDLSHCRGNLTTPVRDLEWLAPQAQALDTSYRRKAAKIYTHGTVADLAPCERCAEGKGPFLRCVIAWDDKGYIAKGNCANCYWFHQTSTCSRRLILPCKALAKAGKNLGEFEDACRIQCHGAHISDENEAANRHAGEPSDEEEESFYEADGDDDDQHNGGMDEDDEDVSFEVEEAKEDEISSNGNDNEHLLTNKRKADEDLEHMSSMTKRIRGFTPINFDRF